MKDENVFNIIQDYLDDLDGLHGYRGINDKEVVIQLYNINVKYVTDYSHHLKHKQPGSYIAF